MMAATSRMMSVTSCRASHTNCTKVFGFFGGMRFCPNSSFLLSISSEFPSKPAGVKKRALEKCPPHAQTIDGGVRNRSGQLLQYVMGRILRFFPKTSQPDLPQGSGEPRATLKHQIEHWRPERAPSAWRLFLSGVLGADWFPLWSEDKSEHAGIPADPLLLHG